MRCPRCQAELGIEELLRMATELLGETDTGLVQSRPMKEGPHGEEE